jgi:hypothetical protein
MTTIAWDGRYLAGDGFVMTGGDEPIVLETDFSKLGSDQVVLESRRGRSFGSLTDRLEMRAYGGAGTLGACREWGKKFLEGADPDKIKAHTAEGDDYHIISIQSAMLSDGTLGPRVVREWDKSDYSYALRAPYFAIGVGRKYCMAVMEHGGTALDALRIATRLDPWTGGQITYIDTESPDWEIQIL